MSTLAPGLIDRTRRSTRVELLELYVMEGPQAGARIPLPVAKPQSVGTDLQNDIYFDDSSAGPLTLEVVSGRLDVTITLVCGSAICDNTPLKTGRKTRLAVNTPVRLGATVFVISATADHSGGDSEDKSFYTAFAEPYRKALVVFVFGCLLLGSGIASLPTKSTGNLPVASASASTGHLPLQSMPGGMSEKPIALVNGDIIESVRDIFRNHGVTAKVTSVGAGHVRAETETAELDALARVEFAVRSDVPDLIKLETVNHPPETVPIVTTPKPHREQAGKAIRLVMAGNPSYVVTEDSSRYFIGSQLPTGHTIVAIGENEVMLEKDGVSSELNL